MPYYDTRTDTVRNPKRLEVKLSDGALLGAPPTGWTDELCALVGLDAIVKTTRPADTATTTFDRTVELLTGTPTVVWTERDKTQPELDAEADQVADSDALAAWLALKPDYIAGRGLPNLGGGVLTRAELSDAAREHRQLLRKLCRGQLRLMRNWE